MTVFDKSFIHSITTEEAAVFDVHFMSNLTPLFFVEVLADLEKYGMDERSRTGLVKDLAGKTPYMQSYSNIPHPYLAIGDLVGLPVTMRGVPIVGGGRRVQSAEGLGTVFETPPDLKAAHRWQKGEFGKEEYASARQWREMLRRAPEPIAQFLGGSASRFTFKDLEKAKAFAENVIDGDGRRYRTLRSAVVALGVPHSMHAGVVDRWKAQGGPKLAEFAPYARHALLVDLFQTLAMASGLIDPDKTSNFADVAYLYYLPFCQLFISNDKLHRKCVPLFLRPDQQFIWGHDFRPHLKALTEEYLAHPELEEHGLFKLSGRRQFPPGSFIGDILERAGRKQRRRDDDLTERLTPEAERTLVEKIQAAAKAPPPRADANLEEEDTSTTIERSVPLTRGRFPMMPRNLKMKS